MTKWLVDPESQEEGEDPILGSNGEIPSAPSPVPVADKPLPDVASLFGDDPDFVLATPEEPGPLRALFEEEPTVLLLDPRTLKLPQVDAALDQARQQIAAQAPVPTPPPLAPMKAIPPGHLTRSQVLEVVPASLRSAITPELVDLVNSLTADDMAAERIRNDFVSFSSVLTQGKFKVQDYVHAVAYVAFKAMGHTDRDAYARAHPQRYADLKAEGKTDQQISGYVAMYKKGQLVTKLLSQTMVPSWILNMDLHQQAINELAVIGLDPDVKDHVRVEALSNLATLTQKPVNLKEGLPLEVAESTGLKELLAATVNLAKESTQAIREGRAKAIDIAATNLFSREADDV